MLSAFQKLTAYLKSWLWKKIDYDKEYWNQCVDWVRLFAKSNTEPIGTFSGSALNGWLTGNPFKDTNWKRTVYKPNTYPDPSSIIFFDKTRTNPYGHVAVVANADEASVIVYEQNAWNGNWNGLWSNAISKRTYPYVWAPVWNVVWWYSLK